MKKDLATLTPSWVADSMIQEMLGESEAKKVFTQKEDFVAVSSSFSSSSHQKPVRLNLSESGIPVTNKIFPLQAIFMQSIFFL